MSDFLYSLCTFNTASQLSIFQQNCWNGILRLNKNKKHKEKKNKKKEKKQEKKKAWSARNKARRRRAKYRGQ